MRDLNQSWILRLTQFLYLSILLTPFLPPVSLAVIAVVTWMYFRDRLTVSDWPERVFVGFMVLSVVSWVFQPSWFYWIPIGIIPFVMFGFYYLLSIWFRHVGKWTWQELQTIYLQFWLGGLYVAAIVIIQQVDWPFINESFIGKVLQFYNEFRWQSEKSVRSVGTSGNSNLAAALLICFALMSIYACSVLQKLWHKIGAFAAFFIFCAAIWCTGSRGAWVGLIIGLVIQLWMTGNRLLTVVISLAIMGIVSFYPEVIPRKDTLGSTIQERIEVWSTAFEIFKENWLLGTLPLHFGQIFAKKAGFYVYHAHNVFLGIASEYGIIGLGLFLGLIFITIKRARRWRKVANQKEEKRLAGMLLSLIFALLGHGVYDYPIIAPQVGLIFMLSIIIIHTQYQQRCLSRPEWSDPTPKEPDYWLHKRSISAVLFRMKRTWFQFLNRRMGQLRLLLKSFFHV